VKSKFRILAVGAASMLATAIPAVPATGATVAAFAYGGSAGGTQINAVGTTISSSASAEAALYGMQPGQTTNKLASISAAPLAVVGAINTDVTATAVGDGFKVASHARAADISLLNGAIRVKAVDTTSTASASHGTTPTGDTNTQFLGLTISGKEYPVNVAKNTSVNIPGVASVTINQSVTSVDGNTVVSTGGGLVVTLLSSQGGAAIGSVIIVNPTFALVQPAPANPHAPSLGGVGYGVYAESHVGDSVKAETGRIAGMYMPLAGTGGTTLNNHVADAHVGSLLDVGAVDTDVDGVTTPSYARATVSNKVARLSLFNNLLFGGVITATAIGTTAQVEMVGDTFTNSGGLQFLNLRIGGKSIPVDVAPNTSIHVANLGTVTINKQDVVAVNGWVHAFQVVGLDIVLDTAGYGLPVGAEVQVGVSQALIWR
jgi:hypothetical protein